MKGNIINVIGSGIPKALIVNDNQQWKNQYLDGMSATEWIEWAMTLSRTVEKKASRKFL